MTVSAKRERVFKLLVGLPEGDYSKVIKVLARSSLEAGLIVDMRKLVPRGYIAHSLVDTRGETRHTRDVNPVWR